ncbi:MAG: ABC transporter permease [candidate division NC10 bacterium RBG_16_65_8]|nr:MAG: ABC transporter permease [candidate division NC10 bacterium RBG_16_65_8]
MNETRVLTPGEPVPAARPVAVSRQLLRRLWMDRLTRKLVTLGGVLIVGSILAILLVIAYEVYPLFKKPTASPVGVALPGNGSAPLALGVDEYREVAYLVTASGLRFLSTKDGKPIAAPLLPELGGATIVSASPLGRGPGVLGTSDGRVIPVEVTFAVTRQGSTRTVNPAPIVGSPFQADPAGRSIRQLAHAVTKEGPITAAAIGGREVILVTVKERAALVGPSAKKEIRTTLTIPGNGEIVALALDNRGEDLFVGTSAGEVVRVDLREPDQPKASAPLRATARPGIAVSALNFLIGDRTLVVGDASGRVGTWQVLQTSQGGDRRLVRMNTFASHAGAVVAIEASRRDKGFLTADASGVVRLHFGTSGETLLTVASGLADVRALTFAPKSDGLLVADGTGRTAQWTIRNPHPEVTLRSLFGRVWYEGYTAPEYVWQSTGGTDDFEPKLSLTPLIYGTLKGTFYALLFAVPIALLSALYASQFMHPTLKGVVKPVVEIMAALPSVVLGFLAGLWLAPQVERIVPGLFLMPAVTGGLILVAVYAWRFAPLVFRSRFKAGTEVGLLIPVILLGAWLSFQLGGLFEHAFLGSDYRGWLLSALGITYDQRNSLVVGIAMGFAVIPIIFTIAEDSLSNVPQHLSAGSLALGATPWQTALRVVLPTASPGIFSAIMIGFGRAVGETMIVLMATGNTPVMDWSIFNGFRALSANIAVELPEAPEGGTLFRVLFLAALLLFIMTFVVNTVAELVRLRLRRKFRYL